MHPGGINGNMDLIYQVDEEGMLVQVDKETLIGSTTLGQNYRGLVGNCRHNIEQSQGGILQDDILKGQCDSHMTEAISSRMIEKFGLNESFKNISKHAILYGNAVDIYNKSHKKFALKYLETPEEEIEQAKVFIHRLPMWSFFGDKDGEFPDKFCPKQERNGWVKYSGERLSNDQELRDQLWVRVLNLNPSKSLRELFYFAATNPFRRKFLRCYEEIRGWQLWHEKRSSVFGCSTSP